MEAVTEILAFDLLNFDMKLRTFPQNACAFIIEMTGIQAPNEHLAKCDEMYHSRIGPLSDFETMTFYSDFTRIELNTLLTPSLQDQVRQFFQIRFVEDMTSVDLMWVEVFIQPSSMGIAKQF